jgi:tRNA threonylcarbamoyladenosine modification (KEOPS) complex  Pcc1 subunit
MDTSNDPSPSSSSNPSSSSSFNPELSHEHTLRLTLPDARTGPMLLEALAVDKEIRPERLSRTMNVDGSVLTVHFAAKQIKFLRVAVSTFLQSMGLACETMAFAVETNSME